MSYYESAHTAGMLLLADMCNNEGAGFIDVLIKFDREEASNLLENGAAKQMINYLPSAEIFVVDPAIGEAVESRLSYRTTIQKHQVISDVGFMVLPAQAYALDNGPLTDLYVLWFAFSNALQIYTIEARERGVYRIIHSLYADYGKSLHNVSGNDPATLEFNQRANDLLHFMSQTVVRISSARTNKDGQRAMRKASGVRPKEYNVIYLRRSISHNKDLSDTIGNGRTLKNQHKVRSHWRRYHTNEGVQWRKISEHLRGPDGTQLIESKRGFHVNR